LKVSDALEHALKDQEKSFHDSFEVGIEYRYNEELKNTAFIVHHTIQWNMMDRSLKDWAMDQKLTPWVAVAAQLPVSRHLPQRFYHDSTIHRCSPQ
jgi:hypothetical protein